MSFAERILSAVWLSAATLLFAASLWVPDVSVRVFLDNASWTLAFGLSAFWAWRGWVQAPPTDRALHAGLLAFALGFPLVSGALGVAISQAIGISQGGSVVFGLLCASASYIAAPAAVKLSLPDAKPGLYITSSLAVTFPVNLFLGIPLLTWFSVFISS